MHGGTCWKTVRRIRPPPSSSHSRLGEQAPGGSGHQVAPFAKADHPSAQVVEDRHVVLSADGRTLATFLELTHLLHLSVMIKNSLEIEIYSDLVCPWCYIGRRRLQSALDALDKTTPVKIRWRPFQLNPDIPTAGLSRKAYRCAKFGSWEHSQQMDRQVAEVGRSLGLEFNYDRVLVTPNTLAGHRLLWRAEQEGHQDLLADRLFHAYFSEGQDIGDRDVLARIGEEIGLPYEETRHFLASDAGCDEVLAEEAAVRERGLNGVPFFLFNGAPATSGAQPPEAFAAVFKEILGSPRSSCTTDVCAS